MRLLHEAAGSDVRAYGDSFKALRMKETHAANRKRVAEFGTTNHFTRTLFIYRPKQTQQSGGERLAGWKGKIHGINRVEGMETCLLHASNEPDPPDELRSRLDSVICIARITSSIVFSEAAFGGVCPW